MIYFIRRPADGAIKIGMSTQLSRRFKALQDEYGGRLVLLAVEDGGRREERGLHHRFDASRLDGEWFRYDPPLAAHIALKGRIWDGQDDREKFDIRLRLPNDFFREIRAEAKKEGNSVATYIRSAIVEHMRRREAAQ